MAWDEREGADEQTRREDEYVDVGYETRAEKLAYLAGLADGVQHEEDPATANLLAGIVEVLADVSDEIGALRREQRVLAEDMDELADELGVEPSDVVVECPSCGREVAFASALLDQEDLELTCPNCGEVVYTPGEDELLDEPEVQQPPEPEPGVSPHAPHIGAGEDRGGDEGRGGDDRGHAPAASWDAPPFHSGASGPDEDRRRGEGSMRP